MRSVSNNRWPLHWPKLIFAAHCCGCVRKMGQCVSVVLRAAELMTHPERNDHQAAWQVCSDEQCGKMLPARRFRFSGDTDNSCVIFPLLSHWFSFPSFCPFVWFRSVQPGVKDEDRHRSAAATLPYYTTSVNLQQSSSHQHHPSLNILTCDWTELMK